MPAPMTMVSGASNTVTVRPAVHGPGLAYPAILILTLAAAAMLRCLDLGAESLWIDEIFSAVVAQIDASVLFGNLHLDVHPPLYFIALKSWMVLFPFHGEAGLRLLSAVFGTASCALIYFLGKALFGRRAGLAAAAILAFSSYHVRYSQELRSYEMMAFLSLASFLYFEKLQRRPWGGWKNAASYFLTSLFLLYTHTFAALTLLAQNVFYAFSFLFFRRAWPRAHFGAWAGIQGLLLVCYLPWLMTVAGQAGGQGHDAWQKVPPVTAPFGVLRDFAGSVPLFMLFGAVIAGALFMKRRAMRPPPAQVSAAHVSERPQEFPPRSLAMLLLWMACGIGIPFAISLFWTPLFVARLMIAASIPLYLLAAGAFASLASRSLKAVLACLYLALAALALAGYYGTDKKQEWREAAAFVDARAAAQDVVLFHPGMTRLGYDYYASRHDLLTQGFPPGRPSGAPGALEDMKSGHARIWEAVSLDRARLTDPELASLDTLVHGRPRVWLVSSFNRDPENRILDTLRSKYRRAFHQAFRGIDVYLFQGEK